VQQAAVKTRLRANGKQIPIMAEMQILKSLQAYSGRLCCTASRTVSGRLNHGEKKAANVKNN